MLVPEQKINPQIFSASQPVKAMREGVSAGLIELARQDERVVVLTADLRESTGLSEFARQFPGRFFDLGVAEQNLVGVAAGLARAGKIPFITSYAIFSPGRNWEQIRTMLCYNDLPVKIIGSHAGVSVGPDGGSHQALEDIALTRVLPRLTVLSPADAEETRKAIIAAYAETGPVYVRLSRQKLPQLSTLGSPFICGQANVIWEPEEPQVAILATGALVYQALLATQKLAKSGIETLLVNFHTIKPLDEGLLALIADRLGALVTVEEHQQAGGFGSAVAEFLTSNNLAYLERVGVADQFGQSGEAEELFEHYNLGRDAIVLAVKKVLAKVNG